MADKIQAALREIERILAPDFPEKERKSLLPALRERFRIENVYELAKHGGQDETDRPEDAELSEIRSHLEPLGLAPEGTPLAELARLAALKITDQ
jgi:hypothetical protein